MKEIIINLDPDEEAVLKWLREKSKSDSDIHVIAKALAVYKFLIDGRNDENIVIIKTPTGDKELRVT